MGLQWRIRSPPNEVWVAAVFQVPTCLRSRSTSRTTIGDLHDLSAMTVQDPLPIFGLKIGVTGGGLLILVIKDRADQVQ
jgi:hypothetical protein